MNINTVMCQQLLLKQSGEKLVYSMTFTDRIATGVTITDVDIDSVIVDGDTSDLVITNAQISGKKILMLIDGGTHAVNYKVNVTITLSTNEILIGSGMLRIMNA